MTHPHDFQHLIRTWWILLFSGILLAFTCWLTGCNVKRLFTNPPHGDSWADYDAYVKCEKDCDKAIPKNTTPLKFGEWRIVQPCECAD